jgi:hypothetical protein
MTNALIISIISLSVIALVVGIFLACREYFTWYWKQNRIIQLLESIDRKLGNKNIAKGMDSYDETIDKNFADRFNMKK